VSEHQVVTAEEWLAARKELLAREKEFTRLRDELSRRRRVLDLLNTAHNYLDLVPKGRGEEDGRPQSWVRRHDEYEHVS
jgi:predicted dithiol-disulfide oxidoreductase (DUF899 family)